jgi:hypothetical protein
MRRKAMSSPSHGENRGSSPLGSANDFKYLIKIARAAKAADQVSTKYREPEGSAPVKG